MIKIVFESLLHSPCSSLAAHSDSCHVFRSQKSACKNVVYSGDWIFVLSHGKCINVRVILEKPTFRRKKFPFSKLFLQTLKLNQVICNRIEQVMFRKLLEH